MPLWLIRVNVPYPDSRKLPRSRESIAPDFVSLSRKPFIFSAISAGSGKPPLIGARAQSTCRSETSTLTTGSTGSLDDT